MAVLGALPTAFVAITLLPAYLSLRERRAERAVGESGPDERRTGHDPTP